MTLFATFAGTGPLKNCYLTIQTDSVLTARKYLRFHFPQDWANLYREQEFRTQAERYSLNKIADVSLNDHPMQREAE